MSFYKYIQEAWKKPSPDMLRQKMIEWRKQETVVRLENPTRLDRARTLGYKAKTGVIVVRVRVMRGGRTRPRRKKNRRSKRQASRKVLKMNYQWVAEQRAVSKYPNLEVLNSYWVGKGGQHYFYEVILVDPARAEIKSDKQLSWLASGKQRGRVFRGLTSAGRKSRGLRNKGDRATKVRPSLRAHNRQGK